MTPPPGAPDRPLLNTERLRLYRRTGSVLNTFFACWSRAFCSHCLEVTARAHGTVGTAAVELVAGRFAGCCQAGVADHPAVPVLEGSVPFPETLVELMKAERAAATAGPGAVPVYTLRVQKTGVLVEGRGCRHLGDTGCRLGDLKAPLCLSYLCPALLTALQDAAGHDPCLGQEEGFCGVEEVFAAVLGGGLEVAERQVLALEERLGELTRRLEDAGLGSGQDLLERWLGHPVGAVEGARSGEGR